MRGPGHAIYHQKQKTGGYFPAKAAYCFHSSLHEGGPSSSDRTARNFGPPEERFSLTVRGGYLVVDLAVD